MVSGALHHKLCAIQQGSRLRCALGHAGDISTRHLMASLSK